jgi:hypothetical protein
MWLGTNPDQAGRLQPLINTTLGIPLRCATNGASHPVSELTARKT